MKVFISQPMRGKTEQQIRDERAVAVQKLKNKYGQDIQVLDTIFELDEDTHPLVYLGRSIEVLAQANLAYFMQYWDENRGCIAEYFCATKYGIKVEEEVNNE